MLKLVDLCLCRLYLPSIGLDQLVSIVNTFPHITNVAFILFQALLYDFRRLEIVILSLLVVRL